MILTYSLHGQLEIHINQIYLRKRAVFSSLFRNKRLGYSLRPDASVRALQFLQEVGRILIEVLVLDDGNIGLVLRHRHRTAAEDVQR